MVHVGSYLNKGDEMKAFPTPSQQTEQGMDLRDYFAAQAMQSLLWSPDANLNSKDDVCTAAYEYADEMMKARTQ
jgi:hypothetical protein